MSKNQNLLLFKPAQLYVGKEWFVGYFVVNPATQVMQRKKVKINFINSIPERKKYAAELIKDLNAKLYDGWNPFTELAVPKGYNKLSETLETYLKFKEKELRSDSMRSYRSYIKILNDWLVLVDKETIACENFKQIDCVEFMDHCFIERKISLTTFNNYLNFYTCLWNWLKEKQFVSKNVFINIKKKSKTEKERILIDDDTREIIKNHLEETDYSFLIVSMLVFHTLIRPKEIAWLKPSDFQLHKQIITIKAASSKNKNLRISTIPNQLMKYLGSWNFNGASNDQFIFSDNFFPGNKPIDPRKFSKKWEKLRKDLKLDSKMKLYSLRDSGMIQMLNDGISPKELMMQADHSSLDTTTLYVRHANPTGSAQIKSKSSKF